MKRGLLVLLLTVGNGLASIGQPSPIELYQVRVITNKGSRLRGVLEDVSDTYVTLGKHHGRHSGGRIRLNSVRKIILKRSNRRRLVIRGAVAGGLLTGYLIVRSSEKNGFSSPVLYGINVVMGVAGGAVAGGLLGYGIGPLSRKVIRPEGRDPEQAAKNIRRQLEPFTQRYLDDVLNHARP